MDSFGNTLRRAARFAAEAAAETLWPTRCALCDRPGSVLCDACARDLPFIDWWRACPRCGAPFGKVQCDSCNPLTLDHFGLDDWPFAASASAVQFGDAAGRLVRVFKDQGERRLAATMAGMMVRMVPPDWPFDAVTFVASSRSALLVRGFDHAELVARETAEALGAPCLATLAHPTTRDQRVLDARGRIDNLAGAFKPLDCAMPSRLLLVDDVRTTGATLCAATATLRAAGCDEVRCLTFARV